MLFFLSLCPSTVGSLKEEWIFICCLTPSNSVWHVAFSHLNSYCLYWQNWLYLYWERQYCSMIPLQYDPTVAMMAPCSCLAFYFFSTAHTTLCVRPPRTPGCLSDLMTILVSEHNSAPSIAVEQGCDVAVDTLTMWRVVCLCSWTLSLSALGSVLLSLFLGHMKSWAAWGGNGWVCNLQLSLALTCNSSTWSWHLQL